MTRPHSVTSQQLDEAIARVDRLVARALPSSASPADASADAEAWTTCRRELRLRRSQSERAVPAAASAAQHFSQAQKELEKGMEHLIEVASPPPEDDGECR